MSHLIRRIEVERRRVKNMELLQSEIGRVRNFYLRRGRRFLDLAVLISSHILLLPVWVLLWLVIPLAIYLDSGLPIFFRTSKVGLEGDEFDILKFRTMVPNASEIGPPITRPNDSRITRIGHFLRRTALDELPQLIAIARGDMSFVGPRAYNASSHELYASRNSDFDKRLAVRPGLTGLAAVYGDPADPDDRLALDLEYIRTASPWLDLRLLFTSLIIACRRDWERKQSFDREKVQFEFVRGTHTPERAMAQFSEDRA